MKRSLPIRRRSRAVPVVLALASALAGGGVLWARAHDPRPVPVVAAPAPEDTESTIRRAALQRFGGSVAKLVIDGKEVAPDEAAAQNIKVDMFKKELARTELARDPAFRAKAENELRMRQPATVTMTWDDLAGNEELVFDMKDTRACPELLGAGRDLSAKELEKLSCLRLPIMQNRWSEDAKLHVSLAPVDEDDSKWQRMVRDVMVELASERFAVNTKP